MISAKNAYLEEIASKISKGEIKDRESLEIEKLILAKKFGIDNVTKNAEILEYAMQNNHSTPDFLRMKPVRTGSGVANIAVMWKGLDIGNKFFSCPGHCIYCVQGDNAPKAYTGTEPSTMRAVRFGFDPEMQIKNRLRQFRIMGHSTQKCELIIMGGTFTSMPEEFQQDFTQKCFDALNECQSETLTGAQLRNETAQNRCVGLTIETRADYCLEKHIEKMLELGCTRVEIGIQTTSDEILKKIERGHDAKANIVAIKRLKDAGLKFTAHWMPGLSGLRGEIDTDEEVRMFKDLFKQDYQPDELKIYPVLVLPGTKLHEMWQSGGYHAMDNELMTDILIRMKEIVPEYVRIKRVMRDISEHEASAGAKTTNLRQIIKQRMDSEGKKCRCIRCREIGFRDFDSSDAVEKIIKYEASGGEEYFISVEDDANDKIIAFLRLRLDDSGLAKIRELHVYGEMTPLGERISHQHMGFGTMLMKRAEEIALQEGLRKISVTSGVGARRYYIDKFGYVRDGFYLSKKL